MNRLVHTPAAQTDLIEYYEERAADGGESLAVADLEAILERCDDLARFPDMGRRRPDLDALGLQTRAITHDGRLIVYTKRCATLHVVRVLRE